MCDESALREWASLAISRRGLLSGAAATGLAACSRIPTAEPDPASRVVRSPIAIQTGDGVLDATLTRVDREQRATILLWPDIAGPRAAFDTIAARFARQDFTVLTLNSYYRDVADGQFPDFADFVDADGFARSEPWRARLTSAAIGADATAVVDWIAASSEVDKALPLVTQGYCLGGAHALWTARALGERVVAAVSLHGAGLVEDSETSPHTALLNTDTEFFFAIARNDDRSRPDEKAIFARLDAVSRVYDADHGWTVPDAPDYDAAQADKAFADVLRLYDRRLGALVT